VEVGSLYRYHGFLLFVVLWYCMIGSPKVSSFGLGNGTVCVHTETVCVIADTGTLNLLIVGHAGSLIICAFVGIYSAILSQISLSKQLSCRAA